MNRMLTLENVAESLVSDVPTVRKMVQDGTLKALRLPNGDYRVTQEAYECFATGNGGHRLSPFLNAQQAADFLGIAVQTLYNNRKHIASLPGFRKLMFDPAVLEQLRSSWEFRNDRLASHTKIPTN